MNPIKSTWKVVGAGTAIAAIGIAGFGLSGAGRGVDLPDGINLRDRVPISEAAEPQLRPNFQIVPAPLAEDSLSSPFDSLESAGSFEGGASISAQSLDSPASFDSPDGRLVPVPQAPAPQPAPQLSADSLSLDSPDANMAPMTGPAQASFDSGSFDSPESFTAPQPAPAQASIDSGSFDSPDTYIAPAPSSQ